MTAVENIVPKVTSKAMMMVSRERHLWRLRAAHAFLRTNIASPVSGGIAADAYIYGQSTFMVLTKCWELRWCFSCAWWIVLDFAAYFVSVRRIHTTRQDKMDE